MKQGELFDSAVEVPSMSDANATYRVDVKKQTCTCPAFQKGITRPCKHVAKLLGIEKGGVSSYAELPDSKKSGKGKKVGKKVKVYTVGHSNLSIDDFISRLQEKKVRYLVDVRSRPYSRYVPVYNRDVLRQRLEQVGITYYWGGRHLGGRSPTKYSSKVFNSKMDSVLGLARKAPTVLMCSEGSPEDCHRAWKLTPWFLERGVGVIHITRSGKLVDGASFDKKMLKKDNEWHSELI